MAATKGQPAPRGRKCTRAELVAMAAAGMTLAEIGAALGGISGKAVSYRLRARGIEKDKVCRHARDKSQAVALYAAGVVVSEIAEFCRLNPATIRRAAREAGLPARTRRDRAESMSIAEYAEARLAKAMAETARAERRQIKLAEMWDQPHHGDGKKRAA